MPRPRVAFLLTALLAGAAVAYAIANGRAGNPIPHGPVPRAVAAACAGAVTPVHHTKKVNNTRRVTGGLWIGGVVVSMGWGPTKSVIEAAPRSLPARIVLRGWRCSDGRPLRFWFRDADLPWHGRGSPYELATTGSRSLRLELPRGTRQWYGVGEILFSSSGRWVIEARGGRRALGTALFDFPAG